MRAKWRSSFTIISAVLPIPGHVIVLDCFCPGRGTHLRFRDSPGHSGTVGHPMSMEYLPMNLCHHHCTYYPPSTNRLMLWCVANCYCAVQVNSEHVRLIGQLLWPEEFMAIMYICWLILWNRWVWLPAWGFLLVSYSDHYSSKTHRFWARGMGQSDRRTLASLNALHFSGLSIRTVSILVQCCVSVWQPSALSVLVVHWNNSCLSSHTSLFINKTSIHAEVVNDKKCFSFK